MDITTISRAAEEFINSNRNRLPSGKEQVDSLRNARLFDYPIIGYREASSPLFSELKASAQANVDLRLPLDWLSNAKSVLSFFLPITETIRIGNRAGLAPSWGWLHARIEGQAVVNDFARFIAGALEAAGFYSIIPSQDERFWPKTSLDEGGAVIATSNWSERHIGHICNVGTFSLSKGLITNKGVAGRMTSLITTLELPTNEQQPLGLTENCIMCGQCAKRCPARAISLETGKNHVLCGDFLMDMLAKMKPYYGCGKCQVGVPCESSIPVRQLA